MSNWIKVTIAAAIASIAFGITNIVQASIPDSNGVIHACYVKAGNPDAGALRVINTAHETTCKTSEHPIAWYAK